MNDEKLKELLSAYTVPNAQPEQIKIAIKKAQMVIVRTIPTRPFSLWTQIKVQATYLSKWFYLSCMGIALLCLVLSAVTEMTRATSIFFGISPLFLFPCAAMFYRVVSSGMMEIEASCKYSMTKLFLGKLVVLGAVVSALIFITAMPAGFSGNGYSIRPLLLAFISFTLTTTVILWFGKRNLKLGIVCGAIWSISIFGLSIWDVSYEFIDNLSLWIVLLIFIFGLVAVLLTVYRYIKEISYEGVRETWNFSLTA